MLDTKLKNRHKIGTLLGVITVLLAAITMVGLYPYFEADAKHHETQVYEDYGFLQNQTYGNYVLYREAVELRDGVSVSPATLYFPTYESTAMPAEDQEVTDSWRYMNELQRNLNEEFGAWSRRFGSISRFMDYQVLDEAGRVLVNHSRNENLLGSDEYIYKAVIKYGTDGQMELSTIKGKNPEAISETLRPLIWEDPMENYYSDEYKYNLDMKFQKPVNTTFVYGMTQEMIDQHAEQGSYYNSAYYDSGAVTAIFFCLLAAVAVIALLLSCVRSFRSPESRLIRVPFEIVAGVTACAISLGVGLHGMVILTNSGRMLDALLRANFMPRAANIMVVLWNVLCWVIPFAVVYWAICCVKEVFILGFVRYVRERTLVGIFFMWLKKMAGQIYHFFEEIDLQDDTNKTIWKIVLINFFVLVVICSFWFFGIAALILYSILLYFVLRKYYTDLRNKYKLLLKATNQIAEGNLDVTITEDLGVFEPFKKEVQKIQSGFKVAVEEEVKSQKMKTDLVTNVSHDLKTPLTAIITYVNLLKEDTTTEEQRKNYVDILEQKSMRLKALIEDLFEISKATSQNVTLNLLDVDIVSLMKEVSLELSDKIESSELDFRWNLPDEKVILQLDSQKTYRIFENLLTNIIKYAMPHSRAYIDMYKKDESLIISMKNVSANELDFNPDDITERFIRGDQSRNTDGSGLGMAIAKSFVELQRGKMYVEVEADLFRVIIKWPL